MFKNQKNDILILIHFIISFFICLYFQIDFRFLQGNDFIFKNEKIFKGCKLILIFKKISFVPRM